MSEPSVSLIISTYNWPKALELCLKSVAMQKTMPNELLIADDGSGEATKNLIEEARNWLNIPIKHIWHADKGFRLAKIRNRAIVASSCDYIIQIDGDLILHPEFISDHLSFAEKNYFITGSRILLPDNITNQIIAGEKVNLGWAVLKSKNILNRLRSRQLGKFLSKRYKAAGKNKYYVKGCNMAFWKEDLIKVNGYEEAFTGWGKEDSELAIRLINAGVFKKFIKLAGTAYHLYHKEASREREDGNLKLMQKAIDNKLIVSQKGLNHYL